MKNLKSFALLIVSIIVSCHGPVAPSQADTTKAPTSVIKNVPVSKGCDSTLVSNEFSYHALAFDIFKADTNMIKTLFTDIPTLKIENQKNEEGGTYAVDNFTDGANKLTLYYNRGFYIEYCEINDNKIRLNKKLSIGMAKEDFLKLINTHSNICDTVTITDEEMTFNTDYVFKNNRLRQIIMSSPVD